MVGPDDGLTIRRFGRTVVTALESASLTLIAPEVPGGRQLQRTIHAAAPLTACG